MVIGLSSSRIVPSASTLTLATLASLMGREFWSLEATGVECSEPLPLGWVSSDPQQTSKGYTTTSILPGNGLCLDGVILLTLVKA